MKRKLSVALSLVLALVVVSGASAGGNTFYVTPIIDGPSSVYVGDTFTLTATTLKNAVNVDDFWTLWDSTQAAGSRALVDPNYVNTIQLTAPSTPGPITISYYIHMYNTQNDWYGTGQITIQVLALNEDCPAAPAIATDYLHSLGYTGADDVWKAAMEAIAHETGEDGLFWAANACDAGYADSVRAYVDRFLP
jgi:hypothetical protein